MPMIASKSFRALDGQNEISFGRTAMFTGYKRTATLFRLVALIVVAVGPLLTTGIRATQSAWNNRHAARSASLDEQLSAAVARGDVPGLVVMAATRDRVLYQGVFGKAAGRTRASDDCGRDLSDRLDDQGR